MSFKKYQLCITHTFFVKIKEILGQELSALATMTMHKMLKQMKGIKDLINRSSDNHNKNTMVIFPFSLF